MRAMPRQIHFLITLCIGVAATLTWQSYSDAAREKIANSFPQLSWLAPQIAPVAQSAPDTIVPGGPFLDQERLSAMSLNLDAVRQTVGRIAASVAELAASQEQLAREISKLQTVEQYFLYKNSEPSPRPAPAPVAASARKPAPPAPSPLTPTER
jgi:hypothetical protein